jgi:hypothetical protein
LGKKNTKEITQLWRQTVAFNYGKRSLDNGYLDNYDNEFSNKYKNNLIDMLFYLYIDGDSNFIQFHYHLMIH